MKTETLTVIEENDPVEERVKVEFFSIYATFLLLFFCHIKCVDMCNCALAREPDNPTVNLFKASLLELSFIVKHSNEYGCAICSLKKELLSKSKIETVQFDKDIAKSILEKNQFILPDDYVLQKVCSLVTIPDNIMETDLGKKYWSDEFSYYLKNTLFLNPLNNFGKYAQASFEELIPITLPNDGWKIFKSIIDDYKYCRVKVFEYDFLKTVSLREMCSVYCFLYSIYDKIAFLLKRVYKIEIGEDQVEFTQGDLFDRKYNDCNKKFFEMPNPAIIPIYLESVEGRQKNNTKGFNIGTFELNEFRNTLEHKATCLADENLLKRNAHILIKKVRDLILETYILLKSADVNMQSDEFVLSGTSYAQALVEKLNKTQNQ